MVITDIGEPRTIKQLTVWSQTPDKPDSDFVCFEPICGFRGGIDSEPILIAPGESWKMEVQFSVEILDPRS